MPACRVNNGFSNRYKRRFSHDLRSEEKPLRYQRTLGLDAEQLEELHMRIEDFLPDIDEAMQVTKGRLALVDGTLWPCWSWEPARELWAGKYGTTGHGGLVISDEYGNIIFVTEPAPGCDHDMAKLEGAAKEILDVAGAVVADKGFQGSGYVTPAKKPADRELYAREHEYNAQVSSIRAPIERAVAHLKAWKILFTDYRRPLRTFSDSFRAVISLYFFELSFK